MAKIKAKGVSYAKWGYIFIAPFFIVFSIFTLYPVLMTFYYSFFERFMIGLNQHGPYYVGLDNYVAVLTGADGSFFSSNLWQYFLNTLIMWLLGFVPQIAASLLLAAWFTDLRLNLKMQGFFKTVIYLPNIIMAAAFSMLMFQLFDTIGPVNATLLRMDVVEEPVRFLSSTMGARGIIGLMNFIMWFGNTTILLMAAMMGIDPALFEAAEIDGASPRDIFWKITMPLINPILVYVMITSMIGGLQMFDIPQILTNTSGGPNNTTMTLIMHLNQHLFSRNFGMAGAFSALLFIGMSALSLLVFKTVANNAASGGPGH
ncbi:MAG: sugar ABC transporter permease [Turicibacter sp.]|nr:sugar ABC transporter permease [Turicibacter sp.]